MPKMIFAALVVAAVIAPRAVVAQSQKQTTRTPVAIPQQASIKAAHLRTSKKKPLLRHPTAAERHLLPADLVAVPGAKGETRYVRRVAK